MASAAIAVGLRPATIESDTNERVLTVEMIAAGVIAHHDGADVSVAFDQVVATPGGAGAGNLDGQIEMQAGDSVAIPKGTKTINHKTAAAEATLWFIPDKTNPNK